MNADEGPIHTGSPLTRETTMESNSFNTSAGSVDAQGHSGESSPAAWGDSRETGQPGQRQHQPGDDSVAMRNAREDADSFGRKAADATQGYLQDAKAKASATVQAGKDYAKDAVNAAGKKIDSVKDQAAELRQRGMQFAADEPMKAVAYAAAGSAIVTAVLLTLMRGRR